jgi:hypothetical protein
MFSGQKSVDCMGLDGTIELTNGCLHSTEDIHTSSIWDILKLVYGKALVCIPSDKRKARISLSNTNADDIFPLMPCLGKVQMYPERRAQTYHLEA